MHEWNKARVIKELVALYDKGHEMREKEIRGIDGELVRAAYRHYGSWVKALTAASIEPCYIPRTRWTEELVLRELTRMMASGESMKAVDVNRNNQKLYRAAGKLFGSYPEAVESLGVDYGAIGVARRWSEERIKSEISRLFREGNPMNAGWMRENENALHLAAQKRYGNWEAALAAVGIKDYGKIRRQEKWTPEIVTDRIREMYKAGERLDAAYVMEKDRRLVYAGERHFGTWREAVKAAGLDYGKVHIDKRKKWTKIMIVEGICAKWKMGEKLSYAAVSKSDRNLVAAAVRHFGSWKEAVTAAGLDYMEVCRNLKWTAEDVIKEIWRLKGNGENLVSTVICHGNERLFRAGVSRFGTWERAVRAAGIEYDEYRAELRFTNRVENCPSLEGDIPANIVDMMN